MAHRTKNYAQTTINTASLSDSATSVVVTDTSTFPTNAQCPFYAVFKKLVTGNPVYEIVEVTAVTAGTPPAAIWTISRHADGSAATTFASGDMVDLVTNAALFDEIWTAINSHALDSTSYHGTLTANTNYNVSITTHGLCPTLSNVAATWLSGVGTWTVPTASNVGAAPTSHAANADTYGYGDATNAGHLRVGTGLGISSGTISATFGTTSGTVCQGNDARLSDTRTPVDASVTLAKMANLAQNTIIGRVTASTGVPEALSAANVRTIINVADGADATAASSTTVAGKVECAINTEVDTGTDATRCVTPDSLAGSNYGIRLVSLKLFDDSTVVTTGDGKGYFHIPLVLNGWNLVQAEAAVSTVSSSGLPNVTLYNVTDSQHMLSTAITIDANEKTSYTGATRSVINTSYDDVATGDEIRIDVDGAGTGAKGLEVILGFQLP